MGGGGGGIRCIEGRFGMGKRLEVCGVCMNGGGGEGNINIQGNGNVQNRKETF
jgi:hypothetical protein